MLSRWMAPVWAFLAFAPLAALCAEPDPMIRLDGSEFVLRTDEGAELRGEQLIGRVLEIPGRPAIRITSVSRDAEMPDLFLYGFETRPASGDSFIPACKPDAQGQRLGFAVPGRTDATGGFVADPASIRLTCLSGALGKCVRFGYRFWSEHGLQAERILLYQSCLRMTRADYCGDGTPGTRDGMEIFIWDGDGEEDALARARPPGLEVPFEAGWTPEGAVCVHHTRVPDVESLSALLQRCPRLSAAASGAACTADSARARGALLFNASALLPNAPEDAP